MKYLLLLPLIVSCTTTHQGQSVDRANYADIGSTAIALAAGGSEANPLGFALLPLKLSMGYILEKVKPDDCRARAQFTGPANSIFYGAAINNLAVAIGSSIAPVFGIAGGILYYTYRERIEPDTYSCEEQTT